MNYNVYSISNLIWQQILGWQQSHFVFFHDFQSKFINTNNKN